MLQRKLAATLIMPLVLIGSTIRAHGQNPIASSETALTRMASSEDGTFIAEGSPVDSRVESSSVIARRPVTASKPTKEHVGSRPFSALAIGFRADTLGAGAEMATPLSRNMNLRAGINIFATGYAFSIDGLYYNSDLHLRSAQLSLDWFPMHGSFHISPGILYAKNSLTAIASVPPGQYFELGDQGFINTVDDPMGGTASVTLPHQIAPTLMAGFGNMIPRTGKHLSIPVDFGVAFTGQPRIDVHLSGTACTTEGCFDAAIDPTTLERLEDEVAKLNHNLRWLPAYPIVSMGIAYSF